MHKYICDMCKKELDEDSLLYELTIEIKAKYKKLEINLKDLLVDHMDEIRDLIEKTAGMTPEKLQDDIYQSMSFHLCPACKQRYAKNPLNSCNDGSLKDRKIFGDN